MKQVSVTERFQWAKQLFPFLKQFSNDGVSFYSVVAAHADVKNRNNRIYTSDELKNSAASLSERPLNINHDPNRTLPFPDNEVLAARYENGVLEAIIQVADLDVQKQIDSGEINHVSIEGLYFDESNNTQDTEYPTSLHFRALALLTREDEPGDPLAEIIKDNLNVNALIAGSIEFRLISESKMTETKVSDAEWSPSYLSNLPDDCFAYISSGGKKDEQGMTTPRSLRHFPYKNAQGEIDKPHLRNALARLSQSAISPQGKAAARKELVAAANKVGIQTSMDEALSKLAQASEDYHIAREVEFSILDELQADKDKIVTPDLADADSPQTFKGEETDPEMVNPDEQTKKRVQIERDVPSTGNKEPAVKSLQQVGGQAPEMEPKMVNPEEETNGHALPSAQKTVMPKMDYSLSTNPLAITNEITVTPENSPTLETALKSATTNITVTSIPHVNEKSRKPIRVTVSK